MEVSDHGIEFTAHFENVFQKIYCPYWDPYGRVYSRGYGETDWHGNFGGKCISHSEALRNLRSLMNDTYGKAINDAGLRLSQNQFDAVADALYNLGTGALEWDFGRELRRGNYHQAALDMLEYDRAGGVVLGGLVERRRAEYDLFMSGTSSRPNPPDPFRFLEKNERKILETYIKYHNYPNLYKHRLNKLFDELINFRKNIYDAAVYGRLKNGKRVQKGWTVNNRWDRYVLMRKYTVGK